uniref:Uncharacterized protein n=1 Tax=Avena sativa TaxID=4498 RepID=A0ACD5Y853_AVESA
MASGANYIQPPPPSQLPPGVYFSPTKEECLGLLNRSIAGDSALPDARGCIFHTNIYDEHPDALRRRHPPASTREGDHTWWFLSETRFQNQTSRTKRADRRVGAVGWYWRLEQSTQKLQADGLKNCFGFYTGPDRTKDRTAWLMQEFTSARDDGAGKRGVPALYRVYVTPHATADQLKDIYGEDGVEVRPGKTKPAQPKAPVPVEYFDAIAKLLPPGSVRAVGQEHAALLQAPPPPPPPPEGFLDYSYGQQGQYFGQYQQQQGQYRGQYYHQQQQEPGMDILGQYHQQQEPFSGVAPPVIPPAPRGLLSKIAADASSDNLSMPMAEFLGMLNEQPAEAVKEEPDWGSLGNIVDDDELKNFNKEG